jgi:predicted GTPase
MNNTDHIYRVLFEMASQMKFRYPYKGMITTEDLWDLSATQLDIVYRNLSKELKSIDDDSLIHTTSADEGVKADELKNKIEIVKYIFNCKQQAAELARMAAANAAEKQRILGILADMEDNALRNMSKEELLKRLNELG